VRADSRALLLGDELQIHSAFANLVDNAANYTPPDGSVQIRWWTDAEGGHFAVTDTGIGIAPEHLPRLTERFYRADPGRSRSTGGSGLGLAIVKHVLQRHGGRLQIESEEGKGSRFVCSFPRERVQGPAGVVTTLQPTNPAAAAASAAVPAVSVVVPARAAALLAAATEPLAAEHISARDAARVRAASAEVRDESEELNDVVDFGEATDVFQDLGAMLSPLPEEVGDHEPPAGPNDQGSRPVQRAKRGSL
jgi:hypothetical protein